MENELWLPERVLPTERKKEGGSTFDDEILLTVTHRAELLKQSGKLAASLNERHDRVVLVGSAEDRTNMRAVFNWWKENGIIGHWPTVKIDYGVPEGTIRIREDL